jgi:hypothetical protein
MAARVRESRVGLVPLHAKQLIDGIFRPNPTAPYFLQIFTSCVLSRDKFFLRLYTLITVPTLSRLLFQQALDQVLYGLAVPLISYLI